MRPQSPSIIRLLSTVIVATLSACGGGGGGGSSGGGTGNGSDNGSEPIPGSDSAGISGTLTLLAGHPFGPGNLAGTGPTAAFYQAEAITRDSAGNIYVVDNGINAVSGTGNFTIRKITPNGEVTTLAGTPGAQGYADGTGQNARFTDPSGIAVDSAGNLYVSDVWSFYDSATATNSMSGLIRKITPSGEVTTLAGAQGNSGAIDGQGAAASFANPRGIAIDAASEILYVLDNNCVRKVTLTGAVSTFAGACGVKGNVNATGTAARFGWGEGIATDSAGNIYVTDSIHIRKITPDGVVTTLKDWTGSEAYFFTPTDVAVAPDGTVYATTGSSAIYRLTTDGTFTTLPGITESGFRTPGAADGDSTTARVASIKGLSIDSAGNLYVTDNDTVRKITPGFGMTSTLAGSPSALGHADGIGVDVRFDTPDDMAKDSSGNIYVAERNSGYIRKIAPDGTTSTLQDDAGAPMTFNDPRGVAVDAGGTIYVTADYSAIYKVTPGSGASLFAGAVNSWGYVNGAGLAARFTSLTDMDIDSAGTLYVADHFNHAIRKISPDGVVSTLAESDKGEAGIFGVDRLAVDGAGRVYAVDTNFSRITRFTPAGADDWSTGLGDGATDGSLWMAQFRDPAGIDIDNAGNVYLADTGNFTVRKITPAGVVSTVIGKTGQQGTVLGALPTPINAPRSVLVLGNGQLAISIGNGIAKVSGNL